MPSKVTIYPSKVHGIVTVPPSKSHSMRAILLAALADGDSCIHGLLRSPDIEAMIQAARAMGASCVWRAESLCIQGVAGQPKLSGYVDAQNSGQVLRFVAACGAIGSSTFCISGDRSILNLRPASELIQALQDAGVEVHSNNQRPPLYITGPLRAGTIEMHGHDSQPVSGLLMALSLLPAPSTLIVHELGERPWIGLTLWWLRRLGAHVQWVKSGTQDHFNISGGWLPQGFDVTIPGDWSSAAFPITAGLLHGEATVMGLDSHDPQGDRVMLEWLKNMGADIKTAENSLNAKACALEGAIIDANDAIDAVPILCAMAPYTKRGLLIENVGVARQKESDRLAAMATELTKMGAAISTGPDWIRVGAAPLQGAELHGHGDHRVVMALAIAAIGASSPTTISDCTCVAKSYPGFFDQLATLGVRLEWECCPV